MSTKQATVKSGGAPPVPSPSPTNHTARALAVLRVTTGLVFLWAFVDKAFGLGYTTTGQRAWFNGGSPTQGFLGHVQVGPFESVFRGWAGAAWADWAFMLGLLGIGVALVLGIGLRIAAVSGALMMLMMWAAEWPPAQHTSTGQATASTNPFIDYHLVYGLVVIVLAYAAAGDTWGFGRQWAKVSFVRASQWLR